MRTLLLLALLLYNFVSASRFGSNYVRDYEDVDTKRHQENRRDWRKKIMNPSMEADHKDWDDRAAKRQRDYENTQYSESDKNFDRMEEHSRDRGEIDQGYRSSKHSYDDVDKMFSSGTKSSEMTMYDKDIDIKRSKDKEDKKPTVKMNCDREHERFENCFAGCAAVTCDNPRERLRPCYPFCEPGCVCAAPYVRDDRTHKCVLPEDCTKGLKGIPDLGEFQTDET